MKKVLITQSNYIPWKGYFDAIDTVDIMVIYDDMQFTRRDWRNRNKIKTPQGLLWLSIPVEVKGKYFQKIKDTRVSDPNWNIIHLKTLKSNYRKAKCYNDVIGFIEYLYEGATMPFLTEINFWFITELCKWLGIHTEFRFSHEFKLAEDRTERLVDICKEVGATDYYSGPAAKNYMNEDFFNQAKISIHYFDYSGYPEYSQLYPPFEHGVSVLDLIFSCGENSKFYLKTSYENQHS